MARVLLCWELGNGLAYAEGLTAGGKIISKAGHEVQAALRDLTHAERLLGDRFKYYQAPTQVIPVSTPLPSPMTFADVLINLGYGNPGAVTARVRAWRHLLEQVKPDIVRCAHAPSAMLAARGTGIRTLVVGIGFLVPPAQSPLPLLRTWAKNADPERMAAREQMVLSSMNQGLDAIGAPRVASIGALYGEADIRELYTYPELDDYGPRRDVKYLGNFQPGMGEAPAWPEAPGKKIFAYLEPFKPIADVLRALAATGQPVLVYMPHAPEELTRRYAAGNLRITQRPLDLARTAQECDLGVTHGGHNIVGTLLYAGKPQIAIPTVFPERITAEKVAGLGAGTTARMEAADLTAQLGKVLQDAAFTEKARTVAKRIEGLGMAFALKEAVVSVNALAQAGPRK
ncbi:MAG TPA: nucleotide disphospho-sugar-binding domain-containing protein [Gammaproteobacteria bacterium]